MTATQPNSTVLRPTLFVALELGNQSWKLAFVTDRSARARIISIPARDLDGLEKEIMRAKSKFGLDQAAHVETCYEAGRDGFWIHRVLISMGIENVVIESSSLEVDRRKKQRKTDRLDAEKMVFALLRYHHGEKRALRVINVPGAEDEDIRNLQRELHTLRGERTRSSNRIKGLLAAQGISIDSIGKHFLAWLKGVETGDGRTLGKTLRERLVREFGRMQLCVRQICEVEALRARQILHAIKQSDQAAERDRIAARLLELRGIGVEGAWTLSSELFSWRQFRNRKQVGASVGLTPTPYNSGQRNREQGISKAGRGEVRALLVELSWLWLRYQPESTLSRWFFDRVNGAGTRIRRIAIVALARKLLVALWKYVATGELLEGVKFKTATQHRRIRFTPSLG